MGIKFRENFYRFPATDPIIFCVFLSIMILNICRPVLIFRLACHFSYSQYDPTVQCFDLRDRPDIESAVHQQAANWNTLVMVCLIASSFPAVMILGALGDRSGRQYGVLLGLTGVLIMIFAMIIINTWKLPLWVFALASFLVGFTGFIAIVPVSCYAYLSDTILNKQLLARRMVVLHASGTVAGLFGGGLVVLSKFLGMNYVLIVTEIALFLGFFWALLFVRQLPPAEHQELMKIVNTIGVGRIDNEVRRVFRSKQRFLREEGTINVQSDESIARTAWTLVKEALYVLVRQRTENRRKYLLLCIPAALVCVMSEVATIGIIALYVFHSPFNWKPAMLGYFNISNGLCNLAGLLISVLVFQKRFQFRTSTLCLISLVSSCLRMLLLGVGMSSYVLFAANVAGMFSNLLYPAIQALATMLVEPEEVGKIFTVFILSVQIGVLFGTFLCNSIYGLTVETFPGAVFFVVFALLVAALIPMAWIRVNMRVYKHLSRQGGVRNTHLHVKADAEARKVSLPLPLAQ